MAILKLLFGFAILSLFAVGGVYVFAVAGQEAPDVDHSVESESATVTLDEWNELDESNVPGATYADDEVIRNDSGAVLQEGTDYEWNTSTGEIRPLSGTDATTELTATYNYTARSDASRTGEDVMTTAWPIASIVAIVVAVFLLVAALAGVLWGAIA